MRTSRSRAVAVAHGLAHRVRVPGHATVLHVSGFERRTRIFLCPLSLTSPRHLLKYSLNVLGPVQFGGRADDPALF